MKPLTINLPGPVASVTMMGVSNGPAADGAGGTPDVAQADRERKALQRAHEALAKAVASLKDMHTDLLRQAEGELLDLAVEIAERIIAQEIEAQRVDIQPIVAEALERVPPEMEVTVCLNPTDLERVASLEADLGASRAGEVSCQGDADLAQGDCRIETPQGTVVSCIQDSLRQVQNALHGEG